jgi:hypothetical protein
MKSKLNGAEIGPGKGWADWRKRRDKAIIKPRKNVGARENGEGRSKAPGATVCKEC